MAEIYIKSTKPFVEKKIFAGDNKTFISAGIKVHGEEELNEIRKNTFNSTDSIKITRWQKQLQELPENTNLSDDELDDEISRITSLIEEGMERQRNLLRNFYIEQILYIKNASIEIKEGDKIVDLIISDTREVKPVESLWETPEECLAALLNIYLDSPSFRDSFQKEIFAVVFNTNVEEAKAKNSK